MQIIKVQIEISGRQVIVDSDQVKMLLKKDALVKESLAANKVGNFEIAINNSVKIRSLNKRIRKNVQFV